MIQAQIERIDKLEQQHILPKEELIALLDGQSEALSNYLFSRADAVRRANYGTDVYVRGLIEFTNYCRNDCYYCGIRRSNKTVTGSPKRRFLAAAKRAISLVFAPSYCRAGRTLFTLQNGLSIWCALSKVSILTAPSPFPWESMIGKPTSAGLTQEQNGTFSVTKLPRMLTTGFYIRQN